MNDLLSAPATSTVVAQAERPSLHRTADGGEDLYAILGDHPGASDALWRWEPGTAVRLGPRAGGVRPAVLGPMAASYVRGEDSRAEWLAVFRLADGRFLLCENQGDDLVRADACPTLRDVAQAL